MTLSNLQVDEDPQYYVGGNPNNIQLSADIIINTNEKSEQQYFYEVRNSQNEIIAMQIHPDDHKIKPNTKVNFRIGIDQPSKNVYFPDGNYLLNAWSVSTWTGRRFDWKQPLANLGHTGIKEWNRSSNVASISKSTKPPIVPTPVVASPPPAMVELQQQLLEWREAQQTPAEPVYVEVPAPVAEAVPVGNLNPYQLKTTIDPKWILLAVVGVGILSAMIFILRGRK